MLNFCCNLVNIKYILVLFEAVPMNFRSGKTNMTKQIIVTIFCLELSTRQNPWWNILFYWKIATTKNSHKICTYWPRMVVLVSKCRFIYSRINTKTTNKWYFKYFMAKSKMTAILSENIKIAMKWELRFWDHSPFILLVGTMVLTGKTFGGTTHPFCYRLILWYYLVMVSDPPLMPMIWYHEMTKKYWKNEPLKENIFFL